jgi:paraquat-inducible protein A
MTQTLIACRSCDLLQRLPSLAPGERARCARCGHLLAKRAVHSLDRCLALTIAATVLLLVANATPLMGLSVVGRSGTTTIVGGAVAMWRQGQHITAMVVACCAVLAPAAFLIALLTVLLTERRSSTKDLPAPRWIGEILRWTCYLHAWSLLEVMLLGMMVALVKIAELARVSADIGVFLVGALTLLFPAIMAHFEPREIWQRIEWNSAAAAGERAGASPGQVTHE